MTRLSSFLILSSISCLVSSSPISRPSAWGVVGSIPRGGDASYATLCEDVKSSIIEEASKEIEALRTQILDEGTTVSNFGSKADTICNAALEKFTSSAPPPEDASTSAATTYDKKLQELENALDAPLQVLYLRQLALLRESALSSYRSSSKSTETSDYEAMLIADSQFSSAAEEATREGSDWNYASERSYLQSIMNDLAGSKKKWMDVQMKSAEKQSTAMAFLQQQQQMIQQLQMQLYGQSSPWNVGVAYRVPDTNFNLQGSYQQGRANVQLSCVPDEYAPMLGQNGFTNGVGPGNLGLSLNLSV
mmetsp:Transcript_25723/g.38502  ORF Transcript_25723/g.38502 Transcript_25723/m.38502 type:complete len:305 (-) Transcript_25723:293-1207(-)|eukprot:CAMPEP_0203647776 /NCGR_PEP_ID=MMETSP0088-20131115/16706_1 /ASSEMBLY_ACC=CAM_ASM_001087 /TAXON_ID=426623 /ORGANISM="Chaetoceros affinis, Strain CCMP159" /LENGTH=304 /DNA_ID=CAMNT_0050505541 /DNA_START=46 /DNA_END=960 /DNA_ORIENTATION=+